MSETRTTIVLLKIQKRILEVCANAPTQSLTRSQLMSLTGAFVSGRAMSGLETTGLLAGRVAHVNGQPCNVWQITALGIAHAETIA